MKTRCYSLYSTSTSTQQSPTTPESTVTRCLVAITTPSSASSNYGPRRRQRRAHLLLAACSTHVLLIGSSYLYFGHSAGLPIPDLLAPYYAHPMFPGRNTLPARMTRTRIPGRCPGGRLPPINAPDSAPPPSDSSTSSSSGDDTVTGPLASQPRTLPVVRAPYTLKTSRPPPRGFDAFFAFA
jgi:hypothetical protein